MTKFRRRAERRSPAVTLAAWGGRAVEFPWGTAREYRLGLGFMLYRILASVYSGFFYTKNNGLNSTTIRLPFLVIYTLPIKEVL